MQLLYFCMIDQSSESVAQTALSFQLDSMRRGERGAELKVGGAALEVDLRDIDIVNRYSADIRAAQAYAVYYCVVEADSSQVAILK